MGEVEPWQGPSVHLYIFGDWVGVGHRHRRVGLRGWVTQDSQGPSPSSRRQLFGTQACLAGSTSLSPGPVPLLAGGVGGPAGLAQLPAPPVPPAPPQVPSMGSGRKTFQTLAELRGKGSGLLSPCSLKTGFIKYRQNWE